MAQRLVVESAKASWNRFHSLLYRRRWSRHSCLQFRLVGFQRL